MNEGSNAVTPDYVMLITLSTSFHTDVILSRRCGAMYHCITQTLVLPDPGFQLIIPQIMFSKLQWFG